MSILKKLLGSQETKETSSSGSASVRKIVSELEAMNPGEARHLAAFAYVLGRVANADLDISEEETASMERLVQDVGGLPEEQAILVVQIAKSQNRLFGGTENFLVTREFKEISSHSQREQLLDCLFAVSAADLSISVAEEEQIRGIANELGFAHKEYVEARARYSKFRDVMKPFHPPDDPDDT